MAIPKLDELDPILVQNVLTSTREAVQELYPELDLKRGVFHDIVLYFHAILEAALRTELSGYLSARSLLDITADPAAADDAIVDRIISNFAVTRQAGTVAYGSVTVVVEDTTTVTVSSGATWQSNGKQFQTVGVFTAKAEPELILSNSDRLMTRLQDGNFGFQIDVVAVETGSAYRLLKDTQIVPLVQPASFVTAYVRDDFEGGDDYETNTELISKLQYGIAAKTISNRVNMRAALSAVPKFAGITDMSIIGFGDSEMLRDKYSAFPVSFGSRVDWYIRTQRQIRRKLLTQTAVLAEKTLDGKSIWQVAIGRDVSPGFYTIENIRLTGADPASTLGGFELLEDHRDFAYDPGDNPPNIASPLAAAYSAYQTTVIRFKDTITNIATLEVGAQQDYEMEAVGLPLIRDIQEYLNDRDVRSVCSDALVKAPVPCFVRIHFQINKQNTELTPDKDAITQDVVSVVNSLGFIGRLDASKLYEVIHKHLRGKTTVTDMDLYGKIRTQDGTWIRLRDATSLQVPSRPETMTTARTVQFFLEPSDVKITINNTIPSST